MTRLRFSGLAIVLVLAAAFAVQIGVAGGAGAPEPTDADVAASDALTRQKAAPISAPSPYHSQEADLRAVEQKLAASVPLPPGGSLDDINWAAAAAQGGDTEAGMLGVIQYRAACKWYQYAVDSPPSPKTRAIVSAIAKWPTFRATNKESVAAAVASSFNAGNQGPMKEQISLNCR